MITKLGVGLIIGTLTVLCSWWYYLLRTDNHTMILICALMYWTLVGMYTLNPFHIFYKDKENQDDCI